METSFRIEKVGGYDALTTDGKKALSAIADYAEVDGGYYDISILTRLAIIKNAIQTCAEKGVAYAEDIFPDFRAGRRGGAIQALSLRGVIKHSGNWRVQEVWSWRGHRRCTSLRVCKAWTLAVPYEDFIAAYELFKAHLVSTIQNQL